MRSCSASRSVPYIHTRICSWQTDGQTCPSQEYTDGSVCEVVIFHIKYFSSTLTNRLLLKQSSYTLSNTIHYYTQRHITTFRLKRLTELLSALNLGFLLQTFNENTFKQKKLSNYLHPHREVHKQQKAGSPQPPLWHLEKPVEYSYRISIFFREIWQAGLSWNCSELLALSTLPSFCIRNETNRRRNKNFFK